MKTLAKIVATSLLTLPFTASVALANHTESASFYLRNQTGYTLSRFYASPSYTSNWEEDILGNSVLYPGNTTKITVNDGRTTCVYDLMAVFSDGQKVIKENTNICRLDTYTLY
jgi:hypothetical protein